ncbi:hypothetical protein [Bradyrhizobium oligotrophicum]|uniref:hypothetical protein n=1 Tax=Bradyrhizobium oligotrophicum TaxID=44255 RepID=UPI001360B56E|nr:hypothetical protein [Bradyrhizobium oligotrophicum]
MTKTNRKAMVAAVLLQNPDDLLFRKAATLHALVLTGGESELQTGLSLRGKATREH